MHLRSLSLLPSALLLCAFVALSAQTNKPTADSGVVLKASARAVAVDVVVTHGNDEPVTTLRKEDFQIYEDGKPQSIDFFEEHTVHNLPGALPSLPKMPPDVYTNVPVVPTDDAVNVLLLDSLNTEKQDQVYMHKQILDFLRHMQPNTRAAIFTLGSKLRFIQGFTSDSSALVAALNDKNNGFSVEKNTAYKSLSDKADDAADIAKLSAMLGGRPVAGIGSLSQADADFANYQYGDRAMMTLEALNYLARYLGGIPGRKNLIWFATSYPVTIFPSAQQSQTMNQLRVLASSVRSTADLLTVAKVAVYPINAQGMMVEHGMEADNPGQGSMGGIAAYGQDAVERADTIAAMNQLAADTGGKAFYNTNDINGALNHAINDGAHYYSIVYTPTNKKLDGKYRRIEVKLTDSHYKLSYRRGYNADDTTSQAQNPDSQKPGPQKPEPDPLRPLLMRGLPSATQLLYAVRVVPASPQPAPDAKIAGKNPALPGAVTRYSVDFFIRWTDVDFTPGAGDTHLGKIQLGLMAYDRSGKAVNWLGATQQMQLQPTVYAAIQKSGVPAHMEIDLPNTDVFLETGVYDWGSNKAGTLEIPLHPAPAQSAATPPAATLPDKSGQPPPKMY